MSDLYDRIKDFEGYYSKPYWDYKQWSVGHGTRASGPNDIVDEAEAGRRLRAEVDHARTYVDRAGAHLDPGTRDALTSFVYNVGPDAITGQTGLADAVRSGDPERIRERLLQYTKAGGKTLPGLVHRRRQEASWIGGEGAAGANGVTSASAPSTPTPPNIPNILASGYGRESGPGRMPQAAPAPGPAYASAAAPAASSGSASATQPSWISKAFGLSPAADKGLSSVAAGMGAFAQAQSDQDAAAQQLARQTAEAANSALAEEDQRAQAALQSILARRQRQMAFG